MNKLMPGLLLALPLMSFAQDKHVHGEAELTIALEGQSVAIEFKSPSANLLGFESAPQNAQELEAVNTVRTLLADYTNLVALNGGNCQQSSYNITGGVAAQLASDKHEDHKDHDEHDHDKHDDHKDHDEHDHDKHEDHNVSEMTVTGFSAFKGLEEVDVDWVSAKQQGSSEVDANKPSVEITH